MKFNFKIQPYQTEAVASTIRVFSGQPFSNGLTYLRDLGALGQPFSNGLTYLRDHGALADQSKPQTEQTSFITQKAEEMDDTGYKNEEVLLSKDILLQNLHHVQSSNNIHLSDSLSHELGCCSLDIEMETGTGKTYVYIKTMFELNKRYGWSKFIVVVPSIAIREGVKKSLEITADHFMEHYGKKARFFIYNSSDLGKLDDFSSDGGLNIMIINTQAFAASMNEEKNVEGRKGDAAARIIFTKRDSFGSRRPIDVIAANRPIIIMDEPQKMGGEVTQKSLKMFKPLFCLNYSATHAKRHNLVYVLDALDAYNQRLVKKIEVKGFEVKNLRGTDSYLYMEAIILAPNKPPKVRLELEVSHKEFIKREFRTLEVGDDLFYTSNEMEQYKDFTIANIDPLMGSVTFLNGDVVHKGDVVGDVSERDMRRVQIRETIISHLEKEAVLFERGIKTLSLFFIDEVAKYRQYDKEGQEVLGEYGAIFEEEYCSVVSRYRTLISTAYTNYLDDIDAHDTHKGYFSIDKKTGRQIDSTAKRGSEFSDDISAYDLILKNKERLLSFEEPTRFIFSHSALREGWDNPNVFQICTLKHGGDSGTQKRQEVGRGLRLCVNQSGNRMDEEALGKQVHNVNMLTVIASEGYSAFVRDLQAQTKTVLYERPTVATAQYFEGKTIKVGEEQVKVTAQDARVIYQYLVKNNYVDENDHITVGYRDAVKSETLAPLPQVLEPLGNGVHQLVQAIYDDSVLKDMFTNGNETKVQENPLNERFHRKEFQALWNAINHHYAYTVSFDSNELIQKSIAAIDKELYVSQLQYTVTKASQREQISTEHMKASDSFDTAKSSTSVLRKAYTSQIAYDLIGKIATGTVLTRRTVAVILNGIRPDKYSMYPSNPEEFISKVIRTIKEQKATMVVDHIIYNTIEGTYDSNIFTAEKNSKPLSEAFAAQKAIQNYVYTDGIAEKSTERKFAEALDCAQEVFIYAKLPKGFSIPTPVGRYTPDWAIVFHEGSVKHVYFIAETKGTMASLQLRPIEKAKIESAKKLFSTLSTGLVTYDHVDSFETLMNKVMQ